MEFGNKNLILIGMPGCGKSTIGKMLSERLEKKFIDVDVYIEETKKMSISDMFKQGETYFRDIETKAINELSKENNTVISTGGGVVKNYVNIENLKKNGVVIFIDRPISNIVQDITIGNRPLLNKGVERLYELLNERYNLYKAYCHIQIINDSNLEEVLNKIIEVLK